MMWFLQGMGLAALMLIGVAAMGVWPNAWEASLPSDTESPSGSENLAGYDAAFAYHLPTLGLRTGGKLVNNTWLFSNDFVIESLICWNLLFVFLYGI
jgi:hypothetical protein